MKTLLITIVFLVISSPVIAQNPADEYVKIYYAIAKDETPSKTTVKKVCPVFDKWAKDKKDKIQALLEWDKEQCHFLLGRDCNRPADNMKRALLRSAIAEHCGVKND
ncbi:MAG: hypothetical protein HQK52_09385 [Oligoflexia bacterium]|nr:hypothetical protein [Oligoflexia bacterium]